MPEELVATLELPQSARLMDRLRGHYRTLMYEVRHPENHKQLVKFLCVGASGYIINLVSFFLLVHPVSVTDKLAFVLAATIAATNNFFWNRHWTFGAKEEHPFRQGVRFFFVSFLVLLFAAGIYTALVAAGITQHTLADGIAWIIATPLSFLVQKLWTFKA